MNSFRKNIIATAAVVALAAPLMAATTAMADTGDAAAAVSRQERTPQEYDAEQTALAAYLTSHGIANTIEAGQGGRVEIVFDTTDEKAWDTVHAFYDDTYPTLPGTVRASEADATDLAAYLTDKGFTATVDTSIAGVSSVVYDTDNGAANEAVDDYDWTKAPLPQADIDQNHTDARALSDFLHAHGAPATLQTDRHGLAWVHTNWDDDAVQTAAQKYWADNPSPRVG